MTPKSEPAAPHLARFEIDKNSSATEGGPYYLKKAKNMFSSNRNAIFQM